MEEKNYKLSVCLNYRLNNLIILKIYLNVTTEKTKNCNVSSLNNFIDDSY